MHNVIVTAPILSSLSVEQLTALYEAHDCPAGFCEVCDAFCAMQEDLPYTPTANQEYMEYQNEEVRSMTR